MSKIVVWFDLTFSFVMFFFNIKYTGDELKKIKSKIKRITKDYLVTAESYCGSFVQRLLFHGYEKRKKKKKKHFTGINLNMKNVADLKLGSCIFKIYFEGNAHFYKNA